MNDKRHESLVKPLTHLVNHSSIANIDLNEMALFTQVVESGGFTPAAKKSGVPLSTVSRKMTHLEERLGIRLLQRSTRHIHLTELGEQYYQHCRKMLDAALEAEQLVQNASNEPSGTIRIATPISMDSRFVSTLLSGYLAKYPKMNVEIHRYSDHLALIHDGYDCAIYFGKIPDSNNVVRSLGSDRLILAASPNYLKQFGEPKTIEELNQHIGLCYQPLPFLFENEEGSVALPLPARYSGNDPIMVKRLAIDGVGICYLPKGGIMESLQDGSLIQILSKVESTIEMSLLYPGKKNFSPKLDSFVDFILQAFEKGAPWDYRA